MKGKTTLKELAEVLNVSVSTVSKALNDSNEISAGTKAKIKELARTMKYVPNELAKGLKSQKTKTLGVIIPDVLAHFFAKSLHGIETTASKLGYKIIICISNESVKKESESIKTLINGRVDGIIMSLARETQATQNYNHIVQALNYNVPIVSFDRISHLLNCDKVTINDAEIARKATGELCGSGCKNIIYLSTIFDTSVDQQRQSGYTYEMEKADLQPQVIHIKDYGAFQENLIRVLKNAQVDGILAADELSAILAMKTILKCGYKIPEDISVIGFTNGIMGENFIPSLTAVDQNAEEQGRKAVEILVDRIEKKIPPKPIHEVIQTSIIHRESTKKAVYEK